MKKFLKILLFVPIALACLITLLGWPIAVVYVLGGSIEWQVTAYAIWSWVLLSFVYYKTTEG